MKHNQHLKSGDYTTTTTAHTVLSRMFLCRGRSATSCAPQSSSSSRSKYSVSRINNVYVFFPLFIRILKNIHPHQYWTQATTSAFLTDYTITSTFLTDFVLKVSLYNFDWCKYTERCYLYKTMDCSSCLTTSASSRSSPDFITLSLLPNALKNSSCVFQSFSVRFDINAVSIVAPQEKSKEI